ncbi:MAG TPA: Ppx/GppA phosphatase family protein [Phycisphaerae bacterium]|nr:Ppx/GppA phosphatase family protein [Phycisphaerae bacterium]
MKARRHFPRLPAIIPYRSKNNGRAVLNGRLVRSTMPARGAASTPHGLRIAAIDIGTNSLHMVIVEVTQALGFKVLSSEKEMTQLGSSALLKHVLTRTAMNHTLSVLARYQRVAKNLECDRIRAYATSAVRESINGGDFVEMVKKQLGLDVRVISSQEEARLIYLAVRQAVDIIDGPALIVDIGGGSAEFIVGTAQKASMLESRKLGASRLTQQFIEHDPVAKSEIKKLRRHIDATLKPLITRIRGLRPSKYIGTSGTMENLAAMCVAQHGEDVMRHRVITEMRRDDFEDLYEQLIRMDIKDRRRLPGLDPERAEQIVAGAVLVEYLFDQLDIPVIEVSDRALREGMIIDYMQTHWPKVRLSVEILEPRRRRVIELGRRCNFDERHHQKVAELATSLFDQLQPLHRLDPRWREILEYAALLHDIGWHIGHSGHHKHSYYLIKNGDLDGFSPVELDLIANIARYHRRSPPKHNHEAYVQLSPPERVIVDKLASILRIAEALDRGHYGNVQSVRTIRRSHLVSFVITTRFDPELELWAARHKTDMFEKTFGLKTSFTARQAKVRS